MKVGLIIGSARVVRVGPQIADFVKATIDGARPGQDIRIVDIASFNLPLFNEPGIPNQIKSIEGYTHETTRVWARHISSFDAFIFLSAQRNWGIPSELKNAIDYLFWEWKGKPAMIVTYGGHGGVQCADHLKTVIGSIGMKVPEKMVHLAFPSADFRTKAFQGKDLGLDAARDDSPWAEHKQEMIDLYDTTVKQYDESKLVAG